jgi:acyl carrier protein phosphodiesterase
MNFLAHLFLAGNNHGMIVGNILEDYIKGGLENEKNKNIPYNLKLGIKQHRLIDTFTDSHKLVSETKKYFGDKYGKFSSIIVDVIFDHYLLVNWSEFTSESFLDFRKRIYLAFDSYSEWQPEPMHKYVFSMREHDWLKNYEFDWGLERAFFHLNRRINREEIDLTTSIPLFRENYKSIESNFLSFFSELKQQCDNFIIENQIHD